MTYLPSLSGTVDLLQCSPVTQISGSQAVDVPKVNKTLSMIQHRKRAQNWHVHDSARS